MASETRTVWAVLIIPSASGKCHLIDRSCWKSDFLRRLDDHRTATPDFHHSLLSLFLDPYMDGKSGPIVLTFCICYSPAPVQISHGEL
jgi:hypothetical protein